MLHIIKVSLAAAFVLGTVVSVSAATKHRRVVHIHPSLFISGPAAGVSLSSACPPVPPCRTPTNDW